MNKKSLLYGLVILIVIALIVVGSNVLSVNGKYTSAPSITKENIAPAPDVEIKKDPASGVQTLHTSYPNGQAGKTFVLGSFNITGWTLHNDEKSAVVGIPSGSVLNMNPITGKLDVVLDGKAQYDLTKKPEVVLNAVTVDSSSGSSGSRTYTEKRTVGEHDNVPISVCSQGGKVSSLESASYGSTNGTCKNSGKNPGLMAKLLGQSGSVDLGPINPLWGSDPCPGWPKVLNMDYSCTV